MNDLSGLDFGRASEGSGSGSTNKTGNYFVLSPATPPLRTNSPGVMSSKPKNDSFSDLVSFKPKSVQTNGRPSIPPPPPLTNQGKHKEKTLDVVDFSVLGTTTTAEMTTSQGDTDDILGDLSKPIEHFNISSPPPESVAATVVPRVETPPTDPRDPFISQIVDMGFTVEQAKKALARTDTGLDVDVAVELLLRRKPQQRPPQHQREQQQQQQQQQPIEPTTTQKLASNLLSHANLLWNQGRSKVQAAVHEYKSSSSSPSDAPKWMKQSQQYEQYTPPAPRAGSAVNPNPQIASPAPPQTPPELPSSASAQYNAGLEQFRQGDYAAACAAYERALDVVPRHHPRRVDILTDLAKTCMKTGDLKRALECCSEVGQSSPQLGVIKAQCFEQLERWGEANKVWTALVDSGTVGRVAIDGRARSERALKSASSTVQRINQAEAAEAEEKSTLHVSVETKLNDWRQGRESNLRSLLSSLDSILWEEAGWTKVTMAELVLPAKTKIAYMKAVAKVHPDKIPRSATTEQKMIATGVFAEVKTFLTLYSQLNGLVKQSLVCFPNAECTMRTLHHHQLGT